jgi:hypothetical protein
MEANYEKGETMQPHQERVVTEKAEVDERLAKLHAFIKTETFAGLDAAEQKRLQRQAGIMTDYSLVLGERIKAFEN